MGNAWNSIQFHHAVKYINMLRSKETKNRIWERIFLSGEGVRGRRPIPRCYVIASILFLYLFLFFVSILYKYMFCKGVDRTDLER